MTTMKWHYFHRLEVDEMADNIVAITDKPIVVEDIVSQLAEPEVGAIATFVGVVRRDSDERAVEYLEYEAYPQMALPEMRRICAEVRDRWPTTRRVAIVHRTGRLAVGEIAVVIAVSATHRQEVFDALHYAIDRLKEIVPIWKKEVWEGGAEWKTET